MLSAVFVLFAALFLSYTNGANDNFKGVATLMGSGTADYRKAITLATAMTFLGSVAAIFLSGKLVSSFSGKGLVPDSIASAPEFLLAVGLGAALTVLIATLMGLPISTTHSIFGALLGVGLVAVGREVNFGKVAGGFAAPLIISPFLAIALSSVVYPIFKAARSILGVGKKMCLCINGREEEVVPQSDGTAICKSSGAVVRIDELKNCAERYDGIIFGFDWHIILDKLHYVSAAAVSFARGLNDTPKIVALLVAVSAFNLQYGLLLVGIAIAIGGLISARKVADTMSYRITGMNHGQGFSANLVTSLLVIFASRLGMPVSTTHVSCGSLFGIGLINRRAHWNTISKIFLSWVLTLPLAAALSAICFLLLNHLK